MKTILALVFTLALSVAFLRAEGPVDRAADVAHNTVDTAKNVGHTVVRGTKRVVHKIADVFTPEADAHHVEVTLSDDGVDMPAKLQSGKTAFIVHNSGHKTHNFEIDGDNDDYEFEHAVKPGQTKVLHVDLNGGGYAAYSRSIKNSRKDLTVR